MVGIKGWMETLRRLIDEGGGSATCGLMECVDGELRGWVCLKQQEGE